MKRLPVLTYHSLDESSSPISVSPARFRSQMERLRADGWRALSVDELRGGLARGEWPDRSCILSFDDGLRNFAEVAWPILTALDLSAIVFIIVGWVGGENDWPGQPAWVPRTRLMDWEQVCHVAEAGVTIGAHTVTHPRLSRLAPAEAEREILDSKKILEDRLGRACDAFAYPYGDWTHKTERVVKENFKVGFGTELHFVTPASRQARLERIDAYYLRNGWPYGDLRSGWLSSYLAARRLFKKLRSFSP